MNAMNRGILRATSGLIVVVILIITPLVTQALPVGWSQFALNGHQVVQDSNGNQWLSPTATFGLSLDDSASSTWVLNEGFGTVSSSLFATLLTSYGLPTATTVTPYVSANFSFDYGILAKNFILDFGSTYTEGPNNFTSSGTRGSLEPSSSSNIGAGWVDLLVNNGTNFGGVLFEQDLGVPTTYSDAFSGVWLYKAANPGTPVPVPAGILLFVPGLLYLFRSRRMAGRHDGVRGGPGSICAGA